MKYQVHNNKMINKKSKIILLLLTIIIIFNVTFVAPNKSYAQTTDFAHMAVTTGKWIWDKLGKVWDSLKKTMTAVTYKKVLGTFLNNLAYDAAVDLAEGAEGKKPKIFTTGWKDYLKNAGDAAAGEFLIEFGSNVSSTGAIAGLDICNPKDPNFKIDIVTQQFAFKSGQKKTVECTLSDMADKWGDLGKKYYEDPLSMLSLNGASLSKLGFPGGDGEEAKARVLQSILNPTESDAAIQLSFSDELEKKQREAEALAEKKRQEDAAAASGAKTPEDAITGDKTELPATTEAEQKKAAGSDPKKNQMLEFTGDVVADSLGVFIDTLSNRVFDKITKQIYKRLMGGTNEAYDWKKAGNQLIGNTEPTSIRDYIDQIYSSVKKISYNTNITDIDLIGEMQMSMRDPQSGIPGSLNDSVIDSDFAEVLRRAQTGDPVTLRQAMEEGLISGSKIFGFTNLNNTQDPEQPDLNDGISYDNMKKLRKNRVIPVGWEMAALKIAQAAKDGTPICPTSGCTLNDVVSQYNQYGTYKQNEVEIKDKLCGWRSYPSLYVTREHCTKLYMEQNFGLTDIEVRWAGTSNVPGTGICYKYNFAENGFLQQQDGIVEQQTINNEEDCLNTDLISSTAYYEWVPGGCLIKEKGEAPLCGLVNPDWVLKVPTQKCFAKGYYSALEMDESSNRYQDCADPRQCLKEDENGKCIGGYGYCLREKNIWKFKGDVCEEQYNGCVTVRDDENKEQSYLINTLKDCPQEQVGCRQYLNIKTASGTSYIWGEDTTGLYLNGSSVSCNKTNEGCNNFINIERGVNLIPNGSFEIDEGKQNGTPDGWSISRYVLSTNDMVSGRYSLMSSSQSAIDIIDENIIIDGEVLGETIENIENPPGDGSTGLDGNVVGDTPEVGSGNSDLSMSIKVPGRGNYVLSYYVKNISGDTRITPYINNQSLEGAKFDESSATDWVRKYATYTITSNSVNTVTLLIQGRGNFYLDNIQFEYVNQSISNFSSLIDGDIINTEELSPSEYNEYGSVSNVFFKKAPDYYNCKSATPAQECNNYTKYCPKEDNGCELYTPTASGDAPISAVITQNDICPSECNKFQSYAQLPNYFDKLEANSIPDPITRNFIADTAKNCSEPSCEEFTNVDAISQGGEGREYYKSLRQCVKPEDIYPDEITIYYTWEGSDTAGFQLKTWQLLESNIQDSGVGYAPCTNIEISGRECSDTEDFLVRSCNTSDLDCRTFYDMNANSYNRLASKTIPISNECTNLRRVLSNVVYKAIPSMSQKCSSSNVGCLEYKGNNGNNVRNIFNADFEGGTINPWNFSNGLSAYPSTESLQYGGSSMAVYTTSPSATQFTLSYNLTENGINIIPGREYTLSFWVKKFSNNYSGTHDTWGTEIPMTRGFDNLSFINKAKAQEGLSLLFTSAIVNNSDWELRQLNIAVAPSNITNETQVSLVINISITNTQDRNDGIYIDNITLKEFQNNFYKIRDSWNTPRVCVDADNNGSIDNTYLGCEQYKKRDKSQEYLYQFSDTCNSENVGCRAVIDTQNSQMPFKQVFNAYCNNVGSAGNPECTKDKYYYLNDKENPLSGNESSSMVKTREDAIEYIIEDNKYKCANTAKGCQNLAALDNEGNPSDVFKINNPDNYISDDYFGGQNQILCLAGYDNCVALKKSDGSYLFKIHPREQTCEYRKAEISSGLPAGFYRTGTDVSCDGLLYNKNYEDFINNIEYTLLDDTAFPDFNSSYAATCPKNQNSCTAFIDPQDNLNQIPEALDFMNSSSVDPRWDIFDLNNEGTITDASGTVSASSSIIKFGSSSGELVKNYFNFSVEQNQIYKLSAFVKFDPSTTNQDRFISTSLMCKKNRTPNDYYFSADGNKLPYATPDLNSNYFVKENSGNSDKWIHVYGLYSIEPGANFCNVAFYYGGNGGDISITNIEFEKVNGYYTYIDNQNIDRTSCEKPNMEGGCVLFHQITDPTLRWNAEKSYYNANLNTGDIYSAGDSNVLLRVVKDRTCGEWATCGSSIKTIDDKTGQEKNSCVSLVACDSLSTDNSQCDNFIFRNDNIKPLTFDDYQRELGNNLSWSEMDYSGYSIPGLYPVDSLTSFQIGSSTKNFELGKATIKRNTLGQSIIYKFGPGVDPIKSYFDSSIYLPNQYKSCRLYPEKDSPFIWTPQMVLSQNILGNGSINYAIPTSLNQRFQSANICQPKAFNISSTASSVNWSEGLNNDCDCSYTKVTYGPSKNLYFSYDSGNIPNEIQDEYQEGVSIKKKSQTNVLGWRGFCLENDASFLLTPKDTIGDGRYETRCLSWYPVDALSGEMDSYSIAPEAEIPVPANSKVCLASGDYVIPETRVYCAYWSPISIESQAGLFNTSVGNNGSGESYEVNNKPRCNVLAFIKAGTKIESDLPNDFFDYLMAPENWLSEGEFIHSDLYDHEIIYGLYEEWEQWYENNVYGDFYCGRYDDDNNGPGGGDGGGNANTTGNWQEKELKFDTDKFGGYSENISSTQNWLPDFRRYIDANAYIGNEAVDYYFYDEGVGPDGSTYTGDQADHGVYEWDDTDATGYRANIADSSDGPKTYIPVNSVRGDEIISGSSCGNAAAVGDAYREGCEAALSFYDGSEGEIPNGHEVYTDCKHDLSYKSESIWNPLKFNYYVHFNPSNQSPYFCWEAPAESLFAVNMHSDSYEDDGHNHPSLKLQTCQTIGTLSGSDDNLDAVFHSDNFYINSLPLDKISTSSSTSSVCLTTGYTGGICNIIKTTNPGNYGTEQRLRVTDMTVTNNVTFSPTTNVPIFVSTQDSIDNFRMPIINFSATSSPFMGYYTNFNEAPQIMVDRLGKSIIDIKEIKNWNWAETNWYLQSNPLGFWGETTNNSLWSNLNPQTYLPPTIQQIGPSEQTQSGITVNGINSSNIYSVKNLIANISFYAYANWGRTPIKQIVLDWYGDGNNTLALQGPYKNKKPNCIRKCGITYDSIAWTPESDYCETDSDCGGTTPICFSKGWGDTPDACVEDTFNYSFVYICTPDSDYWYESCDETGGEPCCKFNPRVSVTDSWGQTATGTMSNGKSIIITTSKGMMNIANSQTGTNETDMDY